MKNRSKQIIYEIINAFKTDRLFKNIVIDFNKSGPNGFEFELLGGCGEVGKSLDIA